MSEELVLSEGVTYEVVNIEDATIYEGVTEMFEIEMELNENTLICDNNSARTKRGREEDLTETWTEVKNRKERLKENRKISEITITSAETFPKQFALAKLFKTQNITNITRVRYVNPYKLIVELNCEKSTDKLINCEQLLQLGWRFQKPWEVGLSYGVIKNIELDLSDEELIKSISSPIGEVVAVKRLKRRAKIESGWTESESVRIGFKGPTLPTYISIFEMKVKVEPYLFPVTQCSRCWRFGHTLKMCPTKRVYCPKCGGKHENCEMTTYKCMNCADNHMSLDRSCPMYVKEKKIRQIMAENNVSYRKAMTMYVPPQVPVYEYTSRPVSRLTSTPIITSSRFFDSSLPVEELPTFSQVTKTPATTKKDPLPMKTVPETTTKKENKKKKAQKTNTEKSNLGNVEQSTDSECTSNAEGGTDQNRGRKKKKPRIEMTFSNLLSNIKGIVFQSNEPLKRRIENITHLCVEWAITWLFQNIPRMPFSQNLFN